MRRRHDQTVACERHCRKGPDGAGCLSAPVDRVHGGSQLQSAGYARPATLGRDFPEGQHGACGRGSVVDLFHDEVLDSLVDRAVRANKDLQIAQTRIREARAQRIIAGAAGLPAVTASGSYTRSRRSGVFSGLGAGSASGIDAAGLRRHLRSGLRSVSGRARCELGNRRIRRRPTRCRSGQRESGGVAGGLAEHARDIARRSGHQLLRAARQPASARRRQREHPDAAEGRWS